MLFGPTFFYNQILCIIFLFIFDFELLLAALHSLFDMLASRSNCCPICDRKMSSGFLLMFPPPPFPPNIRKHIYVHTNIGIKSKQLNSETLKSIPTNAHKHTHTREELASRIA